MRVSIHARLDRGARPYGRADRAELRCFNPRAPRSRRATSGICRMPHQLAFQSTRASIEARDRSTKCRCHGRISAFQSTRASIEARDGDAMRRASVERRSRVSIHARLDRGARPRRVDAGLATSASFNPRAPRSRRATGLWRTIGRSDAEFQSTRASIEARDADRRPSMTAMIRFQSTRASIEARDTKTATLATRRRIVSIHARLDRGARRRLRGLPPVCRSFNPRAPRSRRATARA